MRAAWTLRVGLTALLFCTSPTVGQDVSDPDIDYGRSKIGGMTGRIEWKSLLHGEGLDSWTTKDAAPWSREGDTLTTNAGEKRYTSLAQGDTTWKNYEFKVQATFVKGSNLQISFRRSDDGRDYYFLDFLSGWKAISVTKRENGVPGVTKLDVVNYAFNYGQEYDIVIAVRGHSIHTYIDGRLVNRLTSGWRTRGGIALSTWGRHTVVRFRNPKVRHYN